MNSKEILESLYSKFDKHKYQLSNSYVFDWESDFFSINDAGYVIECEIKISRSDFKADFKKGNKHKLFENHKKDYIVLNYGETVEYDFDTRDEIGRYSKYPCTRIDCVNPKNKIPNKFFYVCPKGLLSINEIPSYAGLMEIENWNIVIVKKAPFLHKNILNLKDILLDKFYYLTMNQRKKISLLEYEKDILKGKIGHLENR